MLLPHEIEKRVAALGRAGYSRGQACANTAAMAGAISAPVAANGLHVSDWTLPPVETPAAVFPGVVTVVRYDVALRWARENGLATCRRQALDLKAVNALRRRMGQPPFALRGDA